MKENNVRIIPTMHEGESVVIDPNCLDDSFTTSSTWYIQKTRCARDYEFGGAFDKVEKGPNYSKYSTIVIEKVLYNNPATIVFWTDGTKTVAKCSEFDEYSPETGLAICVLKKLSSPTQVRELFEDWLPTSGNLVTMKDVRRKKKIVDSEE